MGIFSRFKKKKENKQNDDIKVYETGLSETKKTFGTKLKTMFLGKPKFDDAWLDNLLATLIQADVSLNSSKKIIKAFKKKISDQYSETQALELLLDIMLNQYGENLETYELHDGLNTILVVGVNGSGKTTTCAKLAKRYHDQGKKVLLVGGDTFRAAGSSQLGVWAESMGVSFIGGTPNQDPASVYVDAARHAKEHGFDLMICDSAGRLQNKTNLMKELDKMKRVLIKETGHIDHTYLVIDGNTGQNGLSQAKAFAEVSDVDSLIVTKLDGSPKGGILLSIKDELGIKVSYIGLGEADNDLKVFDIENYLASLVDML